MSGGSGKYTQYAAPASAKNDLLNKLFKSNDPVNFPPAQDLVGKENDARLATLAIGQAYLTPAHTAGDLGFWPTGVDLSFASAPNTADVKWVNPGDPANPYVPDISSPGPGKTLGIEKSVDPDIKISDLKPNYVPAAPDTGTKAPSDTSAKQYAANVLGVPSKLGDSGANG